VATYSQLNTLNREDASGLLEHIVLSSCACLAKCPTPAIDNIILSTLKELCRAEGADHAGWFLFRRAAGSVECIDSVSTTEIFDERSRFDLCRLPWCESRLLTGHPVLLATLADLPEYAEIDRSYLGSFGVRSLALCPVDGGHEDLSLLALLSLKQSSCWSYSLGRNCSFLSAAFLSAHSRKFTDHNQDSDFRAAFRSASVGMALEDTSGGLLYVNEALCTLLGYSETEMVRKRCVDFSHPGDYEREAILFGELFRGERQSYEIEKRFLNRSGNTIWGKVNVTLLKMPADQSPLVLGIVEDITAQKVAIESLAKSQLEVQALASRIMVSQEDERRSLARELHDDIGQRLSLVTSEIHLLNNEQGAVERMPVRTLERLAGELDSLVRDLHNLSHRLHSTKLQHLGIRFALREVCRRFEDAGLSVRCDLEDILEPKPENVAVCLLRIAEEALGNVLKHSGVDQAVIVLSKRDGGYFLAIRDAGCGFNTSARSNGLGLVSIRERVRAVEGSLIIRSRRNEGTEVVVWIPFQEGDAWTATFPDQPETERNQSPSLAQPEARTPETDRMLDHVITSLPVRKVRVQKMTAALARNGALHDRSKVIHEVPHPSVRGSKRIEQEYSRPGQRSVAERTKSAALPEPAPKKHNPPHSPA
jgi:PAS domain S-box-containing protein